MATIGQANAKKKGHANKLPSRRNGYFRDDQIMVLVTHDNGTLSNSLLEQFRAGIDTELVTGKTAETPPRSISFPQIDPQQGNSRLGKLRELESLEQGNKNPPPGYRPQSSLNAFSILSYNLTGTSEDPRLLLESIKKLRLKFSGTEIAVDKQPPTGVVAAGSAPTPEGESPTPQATVGEPGIEVYTMKVEDISPNWLMSVSSQAGGTGGPGGLPSPFQGTDKTEQYEFDDFLDEHLSLYGKGVDMDIAILDTAPCAHDLVLAPKEHPDNILIQGLLGPNGKLKPYLATYDQLNRMVSTSLNRHDYKMTDHGLFAAGIIHSIVPEAKIHLIEVLNEFGVGDMLSLVEGMNKVFDEIYQPGFGRRLVVNCSWMLDLPLCDGHCASIPPNENEEDVEYDFEEAVLTFVQEEQDLAYALRATCNAIFLAGGQVVAAAGNDWDWSKKKKELKAGGTAANVDEPRPDAPEARYPAAFASVIGVGAIPRGTRHSATKYKASSYSNLGDKPAGVGIVTLGGEEGSKKGVLGLYLEETYPVEVPNPDPSEKYKRVFEMRARNQNTEKNCWAWWAGTSFATPILTGTMAAVLSLPGYTGEGQDAVVTLRTEKVIQDDMTDAHEDVMHVKQGA